MPYQSLVPAENSFAGGSSMTFLRCTLQIILCFCIILHIAACSNDIDYTPPAGSTERAITHYSFGKMIIDGHKHNTDLAILPDGKVCSWSFDYDSHEIVPGDFKALITDDVKTVIIGTGYNGLASLTPKAKELFDQIRAKGIQVQVMPTSDAVKLFNGSSKKGLLVCFHLNC